MPYSLGRDLSWIEIKTKFGNVFKSVVDFLVFLFARIFVTILIEVTCYRIGIRAWTTQVVLMVIDLD